MQGASLCEFETWGKDKDKDKDKAPEKPSYSREFKLDMVLELERVRLNPNNKRRAADPAAHDVADGIFHSGLLYESQKAHLRKVLSRRQNQAFQHAENTRLSPQQLMQVSLQVSQPGYLMYSHLCGMLILHSCSSPGLPACT